MNYLTVKPEGEQPEKVNDSPTVYHFIASLVTTHQMSPEDWDLGPMSKRNWKNIARRIDEHNDNLKILATVLKEKFERLKKVGAVEDKQEIDDETIEFIKGAFQCYVGFGKTDQLKKFIKESKFTITRKEVN